MRYPDSAGGCRGTVVLRSNLPSFPRLRLHPRPRRPQGIVSTMPPKAPPKNRQKSVPSTSRELVPVGPREVFRSKHHGRERDENGNKPLTARALVLRHGKHGAMGTGEVVLATRMSGREKLDLLAGTIPTDWRVGCAVWLKQTSTEDLIKQAIAAPFKLDVCLRIADSQLGGTYISSSHTGPHSSTHRSHSVLGRAERSPRTRFLLPKDEGRSRFAHQSDTREDPYQ